MGKAARRRREREETPARESAVAISGATRAPRARSVASSWWAFNWLIAPAVLICVGIALYGNSVSVPYLLDDQIEIVRNKQITILEPISTYLMQPRGILQLSLALNYLWGAYNVFGYHVVNIIIHIATALLVYALVALTLRLPVFAGRYARHAPYLGLAVALVFLAHPLQTMAVTYIIQRAESLASFFTLLALLLFVVGSTTEPRGAQTAAYLGAALATLLGILTKQTAAIVPFVVLLYQWCFFPKAAGKRDSSQRVLYAALFGALVLTVAMSWRYLFPGVRNPRQLLPSIFIPTAGFGVEGITPWSYLITQFGVIVWYLRLYFLPTRLTFDYGWPFVEHFWQLNVIGPLLLLLGIAALGIAGIRRYRIATFCIAWFFVTLAPSSSILPLRDAAFEHRMYLPVLGLSWLIVVGVYDLVGWLATTRGIALGTLQQVATFAAALWIALLGMFTVSRNVVFQDELRLATDSASKAPSNWRTHYESGRLLMEQGRKDEAIDAFKEAISQDPSKGPPRLHLAQIYMERNQLDEAEAQLQEVTQASERSIVAAGNRQLGFVYEMRGRPRFAILYFERAARLMPQWGIVRKRLAALYERDKNWLGAAREYEAAAQLARKSGDTKMATTLEQQAAQSFFRIGVQQFYHGENGAAVYSLEKAVHYRETFAPAHHYLALAYAEMQDWDKAEREIAIAARLTPNDERVITNVKRIRNREMRVFPTDFAPELKQFGEQID
jgi:protein O-mannosyl-transferase